MARELLELRGLSDLLDMMRSDQLGERVSKRDLIHGAALFLTYAVEVLTTMVNRAGIWPHVIKGEGPGTTSVANCNQFWVALETEGETNRYVSFGLETIEISFDHERDHYAFK